MDYRSQRHLSCWHYPEAFEGANESRSLRCCGQDLLTASSSLQDPQLPAAPLQRQVYAFREQHDGPSAPSVGNLWAATASDIEGPTDLDWVGLCFETKISRGALDSGMAQERSNCLQIAGTLQNVESLRPAYGLYAVIRGIESRLDDP